jgi:biotin carboxyl carrier protein
MQANIIKVEVKPGDTVVQGQTVVVLEAMKMEQSISAPRDGVVATVSAEVGMTVKSGTVLLTLTKPE